MTRDHVEQHVVLMLHSGSASDQLKQRILAAPRRTCGVTWPERKCYSSIYSAATDVRHPRTPAV